MTHQSSSSSNGAVERHPHLARPRAPGRVRLDCHLHTMWSGDSSTTPDELAEAIAAAGLDVVCITDHSTIAGALALRRPTRLQGGDRAGTTHAFRRADRLVPQSERIPPGLRSARDTALAIREQGGTRLCSAPLRPASAPPRRGGARRAGRERPGRRHRGAQRQDVARAPERASSPCRHAPGAGGGAGSDAHVPEAVGSAYVEVDDFSDAASFLRSLRGGLVVGHHFDGVRRFRVARRPVDVSLPTLTSPGGPRR